jgi:methylmalonyl-CoA mutase N-terminal domain/subunit
MYLAMSDFGPTPSGIPVRPVYGPGDRRGEPPDPGSFPFTRGNYKNGYRDRLWTFRQYSGFGTPEESNRRYRYLSPARSASPDTSPPTANPRISANTARKTQATGERN